MPSWSKGVLLSNDWYTSYTQDSGFTAQISIFVIHIWEGKRMDQKDLTWQLTGKGKEARIIYAECWLMDTIKKCTGHYESYKESFYSWLRVGHVFPRSTPNPLPLRLPCTQGWNKEMCKTITGRFGCQERSSTRWRPWWEVLSGL